MREDFKDRKPLYSGPGRSGICICGHSWERHHLGCVARQEYINQTKEYYIPQECEQYGCNEMGGCDPKGHLHCGGYIDRLDWGTQVDYERYQSDYDFIEILYFDLMKRIHQWKFRFSMFLYKLKKGY